MTTTAPNDYGNSYGIYALRGGSYSNYGEVKISGGTVTATGGKACQYSDGIYADVSISISGGHVTAKTLGTTGTCGALNKAPNTLPASYKWRTADNENYNVYPGSAYIWNAAHTYVEIQTTEPEPEPDPVKDCTKDGSCPAAKFTDVKMDWTHDGIHYCVENGLMKGTSDTTFEPEGNTVRAMLVTVLYRLEGEPEVGECTFSDVPADQWYTDAVTWAAENKLVEGYDGKFEPTDDITREQFATILYRYAVYKGYDVSVGEDTNILSFDDTEEIRSWAVEAMQWAVGAGLFEGKGENNLDPTGTATRAEMAAILYRFCENVVE